MCATYLNNSSDSVLFSTESGTLRKHYHKYKKNFCDNFSQDYISLRLKSLLEVRQIFKIRTVRKPDVFLPGRRTFNTFENRKKKSPKFFFQKRKKFKIFFCLFSNTSQFRTFDNKFVSMELIIWELITRTCSVKCWKI